MEQLIRGLSVVSELLSFVEGMPVALDGGGDLPHHVQFDRVANAASSGSGSWPAPRPEHHEPGVAGGSASGGGSSAHHNAHGKLQNFTVLSFAAFIGLGAVWGVASYSRSLSLPSPCGSACSSRNDMSHVTLSLLCMCMYVCCVIYSKRGCECACVNRACGLGKPRAVGVHIHQGILQCPVLCLCQCLLTASFVTFSVVRQRVIPAGVCFECVIVQMCACVCYVYWRRARCAFLLHSA